MLALLPLLAIAQQNNTLTVSGTASKSVAPNEMRIVAGVTGQSADAQELYSRVRDKMAKAMAYLKGKKGVKSYETDVVQMYKLLPAEVANNQYTCTQTLSIVLTDFSLYDQLMLDLFAMGFNNIGEVQFTINNMPEIKRQVELDAIAVAKEKAAQFAAALGVEVGTVLSFTEQEYYSGPRTANYMQADKAGAAGPSIAPNQVEVMMSVTVSYSIVPKNK